MPTIVNSYRSNDNSLASTLARLGDTLFGPGALQADYVREKSRGTRRENDAYDVLQGAARAAPLDFNDPNVRGAVYGLPQPKEAFEAHRGVVANTQGAMAPETTNAILGAGGSYAGTGQGFREGQATEIQKQQIASDRAAGAAIRTAEMQPITVVDPNDSTKMITVSRADAIRGQMTPVVPSSEAEGFLKLRGFGSGYAGLNDPQLKAAGALPPADKFFNWQAIGPDGMVLQGVTTNGQTDLHTGQALPPKVRLISPGNAGGPNVMTPLAPDNTQLRDLRGRLLANQQLSQIVDRATKLVSNDPTIVGVPGQAQQLGQNAIAVVRDLANYFGKGNDLNTSANNVRAEVAQRFGPEAAKLLPELFKPQIDELETLYAIIVYKGAEAMFGQSGRDLSDRDVAAARAVFGNPRNFLSSSQSVLTKFQLVKQIADRNVAMYDTIIRQGNMTATPQSLPNAPQGVPPAQEAPAYRIKIDLNGNIIQ